MINSQDLVLFKRYIHFPKNSIHNISAKNKIICIIVYIFFLPLSSTYTLLYHYIIIFTIWILLFSGYQEICKHYLYTLTVLFILFTLVACLTPASQNIVFSISYQLKILANPCRIISSRLFSETVKLNVITYKYTLYVEVPHFVLRSYFLISNYISLYNIMTLTTSIEDIVIMMTSSISSTRSKVVLFKDTILIILLSSELMHVLQMKINHIIASLKLRGINNIYNFYNLSKYIFIICYTYSRFYVIIIQNITRSIHSRNLLHYSQKLWFIF
uniref:Uncharacterized protein n=1 Tax=Liagoropsis maxima TaxID=1653392 RepID=A0A1G4NVU1_9FLOR|nr:Hypothetical protein ORF_5 [Liagoropsis maxima]SCW22767.1 Hypothetical protein ORF_5 [Liagoropsis maxima]